MLFNFRLLSKANQLFNTTARLEVQLTKIYNNKRFQCEIKHETFSNNRIYNITLNVKCKIFKASYKF